MLERLDILSLIVFLPAIGAVLLAFINKDDEKLLKVTALVVSLITFALSLVVYFNFNPQTQDKLVPGYEFGNNVAWMPALNIRYVVGVDGISLYLLILTAFILPVCILGTWNHIKSNIKLYLQMLLLTTTGIAGVFVALDLMLFFFFWEVMLIPMYFLIGIWGSSNRIYATYKFVIYTMAGSALMLAAMILLYIQSGHYGQPTFVLPELVGILPHNLDVHLQMWLFAAFAVAFAIKVPLFPFHTWLPDAHTEAPTAGSIILAGVLLKMGTYGFIRFCLPLFPEASKQFAETIGVLAVIGIIYGALVAAVQPDLKRLVAYSSIAHLGFVMLGLFSFNHQGIDGAVLQMVNHGLSTGALFLLVGILYDRRHTRLISDFGGLARSMPLYFVVFLIIMLSSVGLPGLNGFVGEFLILVGAFKANPVLGGIATTGVIFAAVYLLYMFRRVFYGEITKPENERVTDLRTPELFALIPIVLFCFLIGIYSTPFLKDIGTGTAPLIERFSRPTSTVRTGIVETLELPAAAGYLEKTQVGGGE
ncbi:MAG: NADH-quinone oxidoreductase subunit M [bacterium]|jgi:NADH-quinone oxidoreductase subunit M